MCLLFSPVRLLRCFVLARVVLLAENLALRQELAVLLRERPRPPLRRRDRLFWVFLSRWFSDWRSWLAIVKPATVIGWHRRGFRLFWRWKSGGGTPGRPTIPRDVSALIRRRAKDNVTWGAPRIRAELHLLGHDIAESTVANYLPKRRKPPSQTWKTFLKNHVGCLASMDFFVVPTATFKLVYGFVILLHERRVVIHHATTTHPTARWIVQQLREQSGLQSARARDSFSCRFGRRGHPGRCSEGELILREPPEGERLALARVYAVPKVNRLHHLNRRTG